MQQHAQDNCGNHRVGDEVFVRQICGHHDYAEYYARQTAWTKPADKEFFACPQSGTGEYQKHRNHAHYRETQQGIDQNFPGEFMETVSDNGGAEISKERLDPRGRLLPWDITFIVER